MSGVWFLTGFEIKEIDSYGTKTWTKMKKRHKICNIEHLQPPNYGILLEKYDFAKIGRNDPKFVGSLEKWGKICRESGDRDPPFKGLRSGSNGIRTLGHQIMSLMLYLLS